MIWAYVLGKEQGAKPSPCWVADDIDLTLGGSIIEVTYPDGGKLTAMIGGWDSEERHANYAVFPSPGKATIARAVLHGPTCTVCEI